MIELSPIDKIVLAGYLKRYPRLGFSLVGYRETVAAHSFSTAYIAYELALMEGEDPGRHVRSALWHDFHEALTLDTSYLGLRFLSPGEKEVRRIVGLLEITEIALDADHLDVIVAAWSWGKPEGRLWIDSMRETLRSDAAREIVEELLRYPSPSHMYRDLLKGAPVGPAERIALAHTLKTVPRSGWLAVGIKDPESVAEHSFRTAIIVDLLADARDENPEEAVVSAVLHDLPESLTGDKHKLAKLLVHVDEEAVWDFLGLEAPRMGETIRDADTLELLATIKEYEDVGVRGLDPWKEIALMGLRTEEARRWAKELLGLPPLAGWYVDLLSSLKEALC